MPMFGVMRETFEREGGSMSGDEDFFSVARTTPLVALEELALTSSLKALILPFMPREVTPWLTALRAYSKAK